MPASEYEADRIEKAACGGDPYQGPETIYLELVTTQPTKSTPGTASGAGRLAVVQDDFWEHDDAGKGTSILDAEWDTAEADLGEVGWYERWDAAVDGEYLGWDALNERKTISTGQTPRFVAGTLTFTVT